MLGGDWNTTMGEDTSTTSTLSRTKTTSQRPTTGSASDLSNEHQMHVANRKFKVPPHYVATWLIVGKMVRKPIDYFPLNKWLWRSCKTCRAYKEKLSAVFESDH